MLDVRKCHEGRLRNLEFTQGGKGKEANVGNTNPCRKSSVPQRLHWEIKNSPGVFRDQSDTLWMLY